MLRLEPDDPAVRERIAAAVEVTNARNVRPTLLVRCSQCGAKLAQVGDVPDYGPLFTSSWPVSPDDWASVIVDGAKLGGVARMRWMAEHYETVSESGRPTNVPLRHGVIALLELPLDFSQDYPALMMRCERHGDYVGDRLDIRKSLHDGCRKYSVTPTGEAFAYARPTGEHVKTKTVAGQTLLHLKADVMDVVEFEARVAERRRSRHHINREGIV